MSDFREMTKNNGLKDVEFGSEEYVKRTQTAEELKAENEAMTIKDHIVASIEGM